MDLCYRWEGLLAFEVRVQGIQEPPSTPWSYRWSRHSWSCAVIRECQPHSFAFPGPVRNRRAAMAFSPLGFSRLIASAALCLLLFNYYFGMKFQDYSSRSQISLNSCRKPTMRLSDLPFPLPVPLVSSPSAIEKGEVENVEPVRGWPNL